jgi:hypothetical protein
MGDCMKYIPWKCAVIYKDKKYMHDWIEDFVSRAQNAIESMCMSTFTLKDGSKIRFIDYKDIHNGCMGERFNRIYIDPSIELTDEEINIISPCINYMGILGGQHDENKR